MRPEEDAPTLVAGDVRGRGAAESACCVAYMLCPPWSPGPGRMKPWKGPSSGEVSVTECCRGGLGWDVVRRVAAPVAAAPAPTPAAAAPAPIPAAPAPCDGLSPRSRMSKGLKFSSPRSIRGRVPPEGSDTIRSGSKLPSDRCRLLRRRSQNKRSPRAVITAIPPTTPPTIAPVFDELFTGDGVGTATGVVVYILVVRTVVDPYWFVDLVDQVNGSGKNKIKEGERDRSGYCSCYGR